VGLIESGGVFVCKLCGYNCGPSELLVGTSLFAKALAQSYGYVRFAGGGEEKPVLNENIFPHVFCPDCLCEKNKIVSLSLDEYTCVFKCTLCEESYYASELLVEVSALLREIYERNMVSIVCSSKPDANRNFISTEEALKVLKGHGLTGKDLERAVLEGRMTPYCPVSGEPIPLEEIPGVARIIGKASKEH